LKVLKEVAKVSNPQILEKKLSDYFFKWDFLHYLPGYRLKPVKGSSKVLDFNTCPHHYFGTRTSTQKIYISQWLEFVRP